ncbi:hypothetical protein BDD43_2108 [Mucilaginibacter gracilis]|uniref:Uncharacterized protein n=2 Tax=Mucilaginibacter gracilis TaxID=423350 RepID=A0A495IZ04_9SPHI|nr:hypothetical protein BDD43_2108 [Mucilaginibacter gracilis]
MIVTKKSTTENTDDKEWENPLNPEEPTDARDKEQAKRLYEEAKRQKENLTDTDDTNNNG